MAQITARNKGKTQNREKNPQIEEKTNPCPVIVMEVCVNVRRCVRKDFVDRWTSPSDSSAAPLIQHSERHGWHDRKSLDFLSLASDHGPQGPNIQAHSQGEKAER